jgi:hypothetical protein
MSFDGITSSLVYLRRLAPDYYERAQQVIDTLPSGWVHTIPVSCRQPGEAIPWRLIPHALLVILDPDKFPPAPRTRRLAEFIHTLLDTAEHNTITTSRKDFPMTDEFFPEPPRAVVLGGSLALLQRSVVRKAEFEGTADMLTSALLDEHSSLEVYVKIKNVVEVLEVALDQVRDRAIMAMDGKSQNVLGATVQLKPLPRKWEYDDAELRKLESDKIALEAQLKGRKRFLESLTTEIASTSTGEIIHPARCISEAVTLQVTFS